MRDHSRRTPDATSSDAPAAWTFFRQWLKNPRAVAAFSPSSRKLATQMVAQLPADSRKVIELGGGTGAFTRALLDHGIAGEDLMVLELNAELAQLLRARFPQARVVNGDACDLHDIVGSARFADESGVDAVVSGLGFLTMPRPLQHSILSAVFSVLGVDRPLIQFTYGPTGPLPRDLLVELGLSVRRASTVWLNMPPANVYVYTRSRSTSVRAVRQAEAR